MLQSVYYVKKETGTFGDVFLAYGLATLLDSILLHFVDGDYEVYIRDFGVYYAIELSHCLQEEWVKNAPFQMLAPYIKTSSTEQLDLSGWPYSVVIDLQQERERFQQFIQISPEERNKMSLEQRSQIKPHPYFHNFSWIAERRMQAITSYNKLILQWNRLKPYFSVHLYYILLYFTKLEEDVNKIEESWRKEIRKMGADASKTKSATTLLQLFNPSQGKGQNEAKASRLKMENISSFWLIEYLKAVGLYHCAVPRAIKIAGKFPGDYKVYALAPVNINLHYSDAILHSFQEVMWSDTAVKMDILAALRYARSFLRWCETGRGNDLMTELIGRGPENFIVGMYVTYYKKLGQASAVMNLSFIELPRWMQVESPDDVRIYLGVIEEQESIVRNIDEERGGYELLLHYRDFLSSGKLKAFFDFNIIYASFLMRELSRKNYRVRPFITNNLEVIFVKNNKALKPILENPGFRNIAEAIRRSTIIPQYQKDTSNYETRYGLAQELKRKALYNEEFIAVLSEFMQNYNAENARVYEKTGKQYRKNILTTDIEDIIRLVDEYGALVIGNLLIAFGYAREPKEEAVVAE